MWGVGFRSDWIHIWHFTRLRPWGYDETQLDHSVLPTVVNDSLFTECPLATWLPCQNFFLVNTFLLFPLKCSHQRVKGGPSLYSFKLLAQANGTDKRFPNRYMRQNDWTIRQRRFRRNILVKAFLTHFTVLQFEVFPIVISGPASLNFKRPKQKQKTQHVPEQGRNNNHGVFFPAFYSTHFLPCVPCLSFFPCVCLSTVCGPHGLSPRLPGPWCGICLVLSSHPRRVLQANYWVTAPAVMTPAPTPPPIRH